MLLKRTPDKETNRLREHFFQFPTPVPSLHVLFTSDKRTPDKKTLRISEHIFISRPFFACVIYVGYAKTG